MKSSVSRIGRPSPLSSLVQFDRFAVPWGAHTERCDNLLFPTGKRIAPMSLRTAMEREAWCTSPGAGRQEARLAATTSIASAGELGTQTLLAELGHPGYVVL